MAWRVRKSVKIAPGVRLNFGKKGTSVTVGRRGAHITVGKNRVTRTVGIPGTGIYNTKTTTFGGKKSHTTRLSGQTQDVPPSALPDVKFYPKPSLKLYAFAGCFLIGGAVGFPYGAFLWIISVVLIILAVRRDKYRKTWKEEHAWRSEQKDKNI